MLEDEASGFATPALEPGDGPSGSGSADHPWSETWRRGNLGQLGRFQIRERLGDGGYGQVYLAYDPRLDRDVALKVLKPQHAGDRFMGRFFREARAAARLDHPNIVAVFDAGRDGGRCWIAYQYVRGVTLARHRDLHPPDAREAARLVRDLAEALDHAHRMGVSHRDLKPGNVLIDDLGRPRLTDFGLARRLDCDSDLTQDGTVLGTPNYMPPEQAAGRSHEADERSDLFSLGVILFELLCGRRPGDLPSGAKSWRGERPLALSSPRRVRRSIPLGLDRICRKALAVEPSGRYVDARSMIDDLDAWLAGGRPWRDALVMAAGLLLGLGLGLPRLGPAAAGPSPVPEVAASTAAGVPERPIAEPPIVEPTIAEPSRPPEAAVEGPAFLGNRDSRTLHRATCVSARSWRQHPSNWVELATAEEGRAGGFGKPCLKCHPFDERPAPDRPGHARSGP